MIHTLSELTILTDTQLADLLDLAYKYTGMDEINELTEWIDNLYSEDKEYHYARWDAVNRMNTAIMQETTKRWFAEHNPNLKMLKQPMIMTCLQCGKTFVINKYYKDELGKFTVCPHCEGSFDIDIYENM